MTCLLRQRSWRLLYSLPQLIMGMTDWHVTWKIDMTWQIDMWQDTGSFYDLSTSLKELEDTLLVASAHHRYDRLTGDIAWPIDTWHNMNDWYVTWHDRLTWHGIVLWLASFTKVVRGHFTRCLSSPDWHATWQNGMWRDRLSFHYFPPSPK